MTSHSIEGLSDGGLREKIARVIDPEAFQPCNDIPSFPNECCVTREGCSCFHWPENALAKADAILALSAAPSDGWVLVPREPTREMIAAGNWLHEPDGAACYRAMLSAAPERVEGGGWRPNKTVADLVNNLQELHGGSEDKRFLRDLRRDFATIRKQVRAAIAKAAPPPSARPGEGGSGQALEAGKSLPEGDVLPAPQKGEGE